MHDLYLFADSGGMSKQLLSLAPVDWLIIAIYFAVVLGIGFYLKRFAGTGEDFFMAGRKMTAWVAGLSFISANLSALETIGWSAQTYQYGLMAAHSYWFNAVPAIIFLAMVMMPFYYICKTHSVPGYLKLRYDGRSSTLAGITFAFMTVMVSGASMFAMAKILHLLLGWNMDYSIWIASLTVAVYVTLAGLISAVFNEVVQFFLIWLGTLLIPILGLIDAGGWTNMVASIERNVQVIHPTLQNPEFTSLWRNLGSFDNPMGVDWIGIVFGFTVSGFAYWCTDFLQVQRVIVAKDLRSAQNGTLIGAVLKMCVPFIVILPGLLGLAVLTNPDDTLRVLVPENDPRANITLRTYNDVLPLLMGKYLGPGLLGLGVTAMIAGFMSGMAGNVSAFATVWTYDVYKPLIKKNASDRHYLNMGRLCSLVGVFISIGTAYALFYFSNILEFFQALGMFFLLPLFGVIILGMMWKRCTPAGGFWGLLIAILASIGMFVFVHSFPDGYRPAPQVNIEQGTVVRLEKETVKGVNGSKDSEKIVKVIVESGEISATNVPIPLETGKNPLVEGKIVIGKTAVELPNAVYDEKRQTIVAEADALEPVLKVRVLAPDAVLADSREPCQFGVEGVPVVLQPGVRVAAHDVLQRFSSKFNRNHDKYLARSEKAKPIAVYIYCSLWTFLLSVVIAVGVSLFTPPKPEVELKDLVMGLTKKPDEGPCPWYEKPMLWAVAVAIVLAALNIIFW
ncbi:MAG: sodium/solute symporter [Pirellulales bacterium]|nr:sodium/solute symporter [Pirellulales bacterium]